MLGTLTRPAFAADGCGGGAGATGAGATGTAAIGGDASPGLADVAFGWALALDALLLGVVGAAPLFDGVLPAAALFTAACVVLAFAAFLLTATVGAGAAVAFVDSLLRAAVLRVAGAFIDARVSAAVALADSVLAACVVCVALAFVADLVALAWFAAACAALEAGSLLAVFFAAVFFAGTS